MGEGDTKAALVLQGVSMCAGDCIRAALDRSIAKWKRKYPEKVLVINRRADRRRAPKKKIYFKANNARFRALARIWGAANPEKLSAYCRRWRINNPDKVREQWRNRSARERNAEGTHTAADIRALVEMQNGLCKYCRKPLTKFHVDHIVALAKGGSNWPSNLCLACPSCNLKKRTKDADEFLKEISQCASTITTATAAAQCS